MDGAWRALLEAYRDGRLSASAFQRRFLDAWRAARDGAAPIPPAIERLFFLVEAYAPDAAPRGVTEGQLRDAVQSVLDGAGPGQARLAPPPGRRGAATRVAVRIGGCAGFGCALALGWLALVALQVFAVSDQIQSALDWPAALATVCGLVLAFVPLIGNALAFFGAVDVWGWNPWLAGIVFFAAPALGAASAWTRWRRWGRGVE